VLHNAWPDFENGFIAFFHDSLQNPETPKTFPVCSAAWLITIDSNRAKYDSKKI
jgi:hypothetical protein